MGRHIYFHIPFCAAKCPYCSFYSEPGFVEGFEEAALKELDTYSVLLSSGFLSDKSSEESTVYFGGGTPSVPDANIVCNLLKKAIDVFNIPAKAEKTIEVNPFSFSYEKAIMYKDAGFNRVSIGVQSLNNDVLKTLGRLHDRQGALNAINNAIKAGFSNISADLIIGVPGQKLDDLLNEAGELCDMGVKHISMYSLSIEEGTPFYSKYGNHLDEFISEDIEREMYHKLREYLVNRGIIPYEISNCSALGFESKHNSSYWQGKEYFAIGAGAHGYLNNHRFAHINDVKGYVRVLNSMTVDECVELYKTVLTETFINEDVDYNNIEGKNFIAVEEILTNEEKMNEYAMLMLRTSAGINKEEFKFEFGLDFSEAFKNAIKVNKDKGFLVEDDTSVYLSKTGLDMANQVFCDFV